MKPILKTFAPFVSIALFLPILVFAQGLGFPHKFFGSVTFTNGVTPNGLIVEAKIDGMIVGSSVTSGGNYGYKPNLLFALDNQGIYAGKTVEFYVSGIKATETAVFVNGDFTNLNLSVPGNAGTTPAPASSGGGSTSGGGTGGTTTPAPPSTLSVAAQKVDANKDNKIDVLDFNTLMVHWGSTSTSDIADFDGNGKVDVLDFNLLMVHWTV